MCWRWTFIKPCLNLWCFTRIGACIYLVRTSYTLHRYVTSLDTAICRSTSTLMIRRFMSRSIHQSTVSWSTLRPRLRRAEVTLMLGCLETNWNLTTSSPSSWYWRLVIAHCPLLKVGTKNIPAAKSARNVGVVFDHTLSMEQEVAICKSAFYYIRNIACVRKFLSFQTSQILSHAFVTANLDYCNFLLYGLPKYLIQKLQYIQISEARLLTCLRTFDDITSILQDLHWVPVEQRIIFIIIKFTISSNLIDP